MDARTSGNAEMCAGLSLRICVRVRVSEELLIVLCWQAFAGE